MYNFCTYFDQNYLPRGLALYESLKATCPTFKLWVLCLDHTAYTTLSQHAFPEVQLIALEELERLDPDLQQAKQNRSKIEYYFTCGPALMLAILTQAPDVDMLTYLDADLFFFADPAPLFAEMAGKSIAITEHHYPAYLREEMDIYGIYNVGWISIRRDQHGLACLRWWRERCIEWCYDLLDNDRYADQKYLEHWADLFPGVVVLQHRGANVAPWNLMNYQFQLRAGHVYVDEHPLIFFHFHGFKQKLPWLYDTHTARYDAGTTRTLRKFVYEPYIRILKGFTQQQVLATGIRYERNNANMAQKISRIRRIVHYFKGIVTGQYLVIMNNQSFWMVMAVPYLPSELVLPGL